jgi:hypothetical protein
MPFHPVATQNLNFASQFAYFLVSELALERYSWIRWSGLGADFGEISCPERAGPNVPAAHEIGEVYDTRLRHLERRERRPSPMTLAFDL